MAVNANGTKCGSEETMILQNLFIVFGHDLLHSALHQIREACRNRRIPVQHLLVAVSSCEMEKRSAALSVPAEANRRLVFVE
jgi:hypothetical protein